MHLFRSIPSFVLVLAAGLAPGIVQAQAPAALARPAAEDGTACGPMAGRGPEQMLGRMAEQLKLTDTQKASFKAIFAKHQASMAAGRTGVAEARKALGEAMKQPDSSPDTLKALHRTLSDRAFDQMLEHRALRQELRAVLTPEQREQAARMEGRMEGRMEARRMGPGGPRGWGARDGMKGMGGMNGMSGMSGSTQPQAAAAVVAP
jgi:Spy/CpxP family protein refolding chaperone